MHIQAAMGMENSMRRRGRRSGDGFTLIEVMIALVFVAVLAMAFGMTVATADRGNIQAQNWTAAYRAAQTALERTRSMDKTNMLLQDGLEFDVLSTSPRATGRIEITDLGWEGEAGKSYQIMVTVPAYDARLISVWTVY